MTVLSPSPRRLVGTAPGPLWRQVSETVRDGIRDGVYARGSRLPAERLLCQELGVSRVTLRKGLASLAAEGVIVVSDGRGWFVAFDPVAPRPEPAHREWPTTLESFGETAERMGLAATSTVLRREVRPSTIDEAEELGIAPGIPIFHLDRVRKLDGMPIASDSARLPAELVGGILDVDFTIASLYATLESAGVRPAQAETTIEARTADAELAAQLGVALDTPTLSMHQLVTDRHGRPVLSSTIRYAGDRYRLRTSFSRSPAAG
ncbi:MAG: GntR family transcriptional regulator [Microbacteriaceae bacterium]|nr:GntR family transcriptional regulator [Microbacteriaceae bacterium]